MMDYHFTAQVEDWLDDISRGEAPWVKVLHDFYTPFAQSLASAEAKMRAFPAPPQTRTTGTADATEQSSARKAPYKRRGKGKGGSGAGHTRGASKRTRKPPAAQTDIACPKCGAPMVQRQGPRGAFLGCSRFPACKGTRNLPLNDTNAAEATPKTG
jgi:DNA topoisomerase-1